VLGSKENRIAPAVVYMGVKVSTPKRPTDEKLLRRVARGDRDAFDEFYRRTAPWLALRLRRRCSDEDIVAEVMQETYVTVWRASASFVGARAGGSAPGWLWTIAARRLVDVFRRRGRRGESVVASMPEEIAPSAEEEALHDELDAPLAAELGRLSPELRDVLQAMVLDGLSVRETSVLLGLPEGTVKTRARRARIALREALT
jgi:RNA polymerase sigma-70 factor, ECF subfamily